VILIRRETIREKLDVKCFKEESMFLPNVP